MQYEVNDLVDALLDQRAILFIGSGVSAAADLPDWPKLLRELIELGSTRGYVSADERTELLEWAGKPDYLMLADAVRDRLSGGVFQDALARKFGDGALKPTELHKALAGLPFAAFVTTNFDRLFENAWSDVKRTSLEVLTHLDRAALRNPLGRDFPFLLKTHGCASKPESLVLGLREFRESIHDNRACQTLLQTMFLRYQVLFIGHSLTDPDLLFLLDGLVATFGVPPGRHLALIKDADVGPLRARTFRDNYGIDVLRYHATPGHPEVLAFVQYLGTRVQERRAELSLEISRKLSEELQRQASPASVVEVTMPVATTTQPRPPGQYSAPTLSEYGTRYLDSSTWAKLAPWYASLGGTPYLELLRVNLDRECAREDLDPLIWQEFLRRVAALGPTPADQFGSLRQVAADDPGLFILRGKAIKDARPLRRYLRYDDFERTILMQERLPIDSGLDSAQSSPDGLALENALLGRPGRPVWCTDGTYAKVTDPDVIAHDMWPQSVPGTVGPIVEIAYSQDVLLPDNYARVATVPDMYWSNFFEFINVKKPALGEGDWGHTVRLDDPTLRDLAPSAVHAPLRLLAARTKRITLRTIGARDA